MHDSTDLLVARARRLASERILPAVEVETAPVTVTAYQLPGEPVPFAEAVRNSFGPFAVGEPWGPAWSTTWFRMSGTVPAHWQGLRAELMVDLGFTPGGGPGFQCEGLAFRADGTYISGVEPRIQYVRVADQADGGDAVDIYVEAAANPDVISDAFRPTDLGERFTAPERPLYRLVRAELVVRDLEVAAFAVDLDVVTGLIEQLVPADPQRGRLVAALGRACDAVRLDDVRGSVGKARDLLAPALSGPAAPSAHRVSAIGHAHIDSAWLWPTRETVRKVSRTFSNVVALMDDYPELLFVASSAQQYAWLQRHHPALFQRVKDRVAEGRFIPIGGMWVESDTNLPGPEGLVRQFTQGTRYFREQFQAETDVLWLPDSFGYSAAVPQIAKLAGMKYFVTQKLSWSPVNKFPHHSFLWEGIDGSRLLAHMPPVDNYLSELTPAELAHASRNHRDDADVSTSIVPFGHGDGGGGPTALMMERARRQADLEGSPTVQVETPQQFFHALERDYPQPPVWVGELYLEGHRGTYTSQAAMKRGNRRSEHRLREAELWSAAATLNAGAGYPYEELDDLWQRTLLNQFHDILPGSSIAWVHREAREQFEGIEAELEELIARALAVLAGKGGKPMVFEAVTGTAAAPAPILTAPQVEVTPDGLLIDNGVLQVSIDARGAIRSVRDLRADREIVPEGEELAGFAVHTDFPNAFDAWDLDQFYRGSRVMLVPDSSEVRTEGDRVLIETVRTVGASRVRQVASVATGDTGIDLAVEVDWQERETILKAEFPLDLRADTARSEIQFGFIERPITTNTQWEAQKFEVCAQRWVHVGENGYGVAVVNDSTYGHDFTRTVFPGRTRPGTVVRLSLLRSPSFPDPQADRGTHTLRYRIELGADVLKATDAGLRLNLPPRQITGAAGEVGPLVQVDGSARISAVKLADDRSGDLVVRLYEAAGQRTRTTVQWGADVIGVRRVDLHEQDLHEQDLAETMLAVTDGRLELSLVPFEIVTLRATVQRQRM